MAETDDNTSKQPAEQAKASPISGVAPPAEHRWAQGQSGNPAGRPKTAGASVQEHMNAIAAADLSELDIRKIARDKSLPWSRRAAAERMLRTLETGDIADFAGWQRGENNLEDLRAMGINTEVVKKIKQKTRKVPIPGGKGEIEEIVEREIELHDRAGADFDRVMDRTLGKPTQAMDLTSDGKSISFAFVVAKPGGPAIPPALPDPNVDADRNPPQAG